MCFKLVQKMYYAYYSTCSYLVTYEHYDRLVSNLFFRPIAVFFSKLNFFIMKTAKIPVYGHISVYGNIALSV